MALDVGYVRGLLPRSATAGSHFDPQAGMPIPDSVSSAVPTGIPAVLRPAESGSTPTGRATADVTDRARGPSPTLWAATPPGGLGNPRPRLISALTESLLSRAKPSAHIVVSRTDDEENIIPWLRLAKRSGWNTRWAEIDVETGERRRGSTRNS